MSRWRWYHLLGVKDEPLSPYWREDDGPPTRGWDVTGPLLVLVVAVLVAVGFFLVRVIAAVL